MLEILRPFIDVLFAALKFFHGVSGNWGVAIVLLTVSVRAVLLPLTIKQTRSMKAMQDVQPKLAALRERYKDDRERLGQEMMKFYKENKINPFSGCLPMLPQIPIMLALYYMLVNKQINNGVLEGASFLWISDLTAIHDIPLVALMAITQLASMLMVTKDPQQKKMMIPFVLILPIITWSLPSGVVLYWVTMNIWVIGQQWIQFKYTPSMLSLSGGKARQDSASRESKAVPVKVQGKDQEKSAEAASGSDKNNARRKNPQKKRRKA